MRAVADLSAEEARRLRGVLFDLDDTLLSDGVLTRAAYDALWDLREAGLSLVAVTGRPAGWGELLARQWPIDAAVTENGAIAVVRQGRAVVRVDACPAAERVRRRRALAQLVAEVRREVPEVGLTDDVELRISDVTWDVGEHVTVAEDVVARLAAAVGRSGARVSRSSVHFHATFDADDKATGTVRWLAARGEDPGSARVRYAFVGDSGNDAACFAAFTTTFGVANVRAQLTRMAVPPRWVASRPMGEGFAEIARHILRLR